MRVVATALLMLIEGQILATACMKNYGGPTCKNGVSDVHEILRQEIASRILRIQYCSQAG